MEKTMKSVCGISIVIFIVFVILDVYIIDAITNSISISVFLYFLYDKWLWRFNPFVNVPRIYGCYRNDVVSTYDGGISYDSMVYIKQTLSKVIVVEKMRDGVCVSVVSSLYKYNQEDDLWFLYYTYLTHPKIPSDDMHFGTSILYIKDKLTLEGFYFTNRLKQTKGKQILTRINNKTSRDAKLS